MMIINKQKLQEALEIVKPGLSNKDSIEQATSFAFTKGNVVTYNDEISISHPVEGVEFEGAVVADKLYALINKIKKDEIDIELKDNEIIITSGRSKAGLTIASEIKLPLSEVETKGKWKPLPKNFNKFLKLAMASCGKDLSRPILSCVHITKEGIVEASDGYRVTQCTLEEQMPIKDFLLPATSANNVSKLNPTKVSEGKGWIHFQTEGGTVISCRVFEAKYPNINSILTMDETTRLILPKTIQEVLDRANVFARRDTVLEEVVNVVIDNNRFKISAEADGGEGWFEEEVNLKYGGEKISFYITPYLLKGILNETQECNLGTKKLKFHGEGWIYLTMLRGV